MEQTQEIKYCSIKIKITEEETIKISTISNGEEIPTKLKEENQEEYPCSISFENNKILICQDNKNSIHFINDVFVLYSIFEFIHNQSKKDFCNNFVLFLLILN